jgi:hypothetical protein
MVQNSVNNDYNDLLIVVTVILWYKSGEQIVTIYMTML